MSDNEIISERDDKTGRFLAGNSGGGRKPGARNKLSEAFIADVQASWERNGVEVLERLAKEEPGVYLRALVALMPKDVSLTIGLNPTDFHQKFEAAVEALGNRVPERRVKVINGR